MRLWLLLGISILDWLHGIGGPGLILLGLLDSSVIPLPGSMDISVVLLSSARPGWWPFYGVMATLGGLAGGWLTYRLAKQGGGRRLANKIGKRRAFVINKRFEKRGGITIFLGAVLPPPFPIVPFLMAAGVMRYPRRKFLAALGSGRAVRYFGLAYIGHSYGTDILSFFARYKMSILYAVLALAVLGVVAALLYFRYYRPWRSARERVEDEAIDLVLGPEDLEVGLEDSDEPSAPAETQEDSRRKTA